MHYVILRDDDTNPRTPIACLERLYRPFLDKGLPVNLATIPNARADTFHDNGEPEGFLLGQTGSEALPIAGNAELVAYLRANPCFHILQHGYHHQIFEFERCSGRELARRLDHGRTLLQEAGFSAPRTFVAPYDRISSAAYHELAQRFDVVSTGWFELKRLPVTWWPDYLLARKFRHQPHWQHGHTRYLSHPGCLLSYRRPLDSMLTTVRNAVLTQHVTVLVTHWWEYFYQGETNLPFIDKLHEVAAFLADRKDVEVISFDALVERNISLN